MARMTEQKYRIGATVTMTEHMGTVYKGYGTGVITSTYLALSRYTGNTNRQYTVKWENGEITNGIYNGDIAQLECSLSHYED